MISEIGKIEKEVGTEEKEIERLERVKAGKKKRKR
jgi:hypothetical protein